MVICGNKIMFPIKVICKLCVCLPLEIGIQTVWQPKYINHAGLLHCMKHNCVTRVSLMGNKTYFVGNIFIEDMYFNLRDHG